MSVYQHEISGINKQSECLSQCKYYIFKIKNGIRKKYNTAYNAEIPESNGYYAFFSFFRIYPLNYESHAKTYLS